jgi:uncharacterized protein YndB with AHSA1/START domain
MFTVHRVIRSDPADVWAVLADGWLFPLWVVGATRMRQVDPHWPAEGARLHHSIGSWPMLIDDTTSVTGSEPGKVLSLLASAGPTGKVAVDIELVPENGGTRVTMSEDVVAGPGSYVPAPLRSPLLRWRNVEALRRLSLIVENRQHT